MKEAKKILVIAVVALSLFSVQSQSAIFKVTDSAGLQTALDSARTNGENDIIYLQQGEYVTNGGSFTYGTADNDSCSVTLSGGWNPKFTTQDSDPYVTQLNGDNSNPVLQILANAADVNITFAIENLTILDGYTQSSDTGGAGIFAYTGSTTDLGSIHLTIRNCLIKDNFADNSKSGGAIYSNCTLDVHNSRFLSNSAYNGGAMVISYDNDEGASASPVLDNCYFEDNYNYGNQGSTIWTNCALQVRNCIFKGRTDGVTESGPGSCIWGNGGSHLNITNSSFTDIIIKYWGSAVQVWDGNLDITNCLFANNIAGNTGDGYGAIAFLRNSSAYTVNVTNCTFVGNASAVESFAGAIHNRGATMNLNNCIFWDNDGDTGVYNESGTTTMRYCDCYNGLGSTVINGGGNLNEDPVFIGDEIYHLGHSSPCIDAGNNNLVPADSQDLDNDGNTTEPTPFDLAGQARFYDDPCTVDTGNGTAPIVDIGAFEYQPARFGTINGKNITLTLEDCDGNNVTFSLTGGGYGEIDESDCSFSEIILSGTGEKSQLTISTKGKTETSIGDIISNGPLKAISAKNVNVWGNINIGGSLGTLVLNDVSGLHDTISIGEPAVPNPKAAVTMVFDRLSGVVDIESDIPVKSITATEWLDGQLNAPWVGSLTIKGDKKRSIAGDLSMDMLLTGDSTPKGITLGNVKVAGTIAGGYWNITGNIGTVLTAASDVSFEISADDSNIAALKAVGNKALGLSATLSGDFSFYTAKSVSAGDFYNTSLKLFQSPPDSTGKIFALGSLTVKGQIDISKITSNGNIGTVTIGKMVNSTCFAGVADACLVDLNIDGVLDLPPVLDDTFSKDATIKSVTVKGIKGNSPPYFINSNIAAKNMSAISIAYPQYSNSGTPFGITMYNNPKSLMIKDDEGKHSWKGIDIGEAIDWLLALFNNDMEIRRD